MICVFHFCALTEPPPHVRVRAQPSCGSPTPNAHSAFYLLLLHGSRLPRRHLHHPAGGTCATELCDLDTQMSIHTQRTLVSRTHHTNIQRERRREQLAYAEAKAKLQLIERERDRLADLDLANSYDSLISCPICLEVGCVRTCVWHRSDRQVMLTPKPHRSSIYRAGVQDRPAGGGERPRDCAPPHRQAW